MADTQPYRPRKRGFETAADMLRSLIPIVILVLGFAYFCIPRAGETDHRIDPTSDITSAARTVDFEVVAPADLPKDWMPTSSALLRVDNSRTANPNGLTIGYVTPDEQFARFTIRQADRPDVLADALGKARVTKDPDGEDRELGSYVWTPIKTSRGQALITEVDGVIILVSGSASYAELSELAASLQPVTPK